MDRQAWVWQDEWYGLTMDDIRDIGDHPSQFSYFFKHWGEGGAVQIQIQHQIPNWMSLFVFHPACVFAFFSSHFEVFTV